MEGIGIALFVGSALFVVVGGMLYHLITGPFQAKRKKAEPVPPPITPKVESDANKASNEASKKPDQSSVDFFNQLAKK